jgi:hypothetical protein
MSAIMKYQIIKGNVTIDFERFRVNADFCEENEIQKDFDKRSYQVNDSEVALNEIRSFIRDSVKQLQNGNKVIFTRTNGGPPKIFEDIDSFKEWITEFFDKPNYQFINVSAKR